MWHYNHMPNDPFLCHYGVKGMRWGIRKIREQLDKTTSSGRMNLQLFAKKARHLKTVILPVQEFAHVMSELRTNITKEQKLQHIFQKDIGDYTYKFENYFNDTYRIIGKRRIPNTLTGLLKREND